MDYKDIINNSTRIPQINNLLSRRTYDELSDAHKNIIITNVPYIIEENIENVYPTLKRIYGRRRTLFNVEDGPLRLFSFGGRPYRTFTRTRPTERIAALNEKEINLTGVADEEEREEAILTLEDELARNPIGEISQWAEGEVDFFNKLIEILKTEVEIVEGEEYDFEALQDVRTKMTAFDLPNPANREKYYAFWEDTNNKFKEVVEAMDNVLSEAEEAIKTVTIGDIVGSPEKIIQTVRNLLDQLKTNNIKLPNYILKLPPMSIKNLKEEYLPMYLTSKFFEEMGQEFNLATGAVFSPEKLLGQFTGIDVKPDEEPTGYIDENVNQLVNEYEDAKGKMYMIDEKNPNLSTIDPLLVIHKFTEDKTEVYEVTDKLIEDVKREIKEVASIDEGSDFLEELTEIFDEEIDKFIDEIKKQGNLMAAGRHFYLPILDDENHIQAFDNKYWGREVQFQYEYYDCATQKKEWSNHINKYDQIVKEINKEMKKFIDFYADFMKVTKNIFPAISKPPRIRGRGVRGMGRGEEEYMAGGTIVTTSGRMSEVDVEIRDALESINNVLRDFYIEPLQTQYVIEGDFPEFFKEARFIDISTHLSNASPQKLINMLAKGEEPNISGEDIDNISKFMNKTRDLASLDYDDDTKRLFTNALGSITNLFENVSVDDASEELALGEIINRWSILLGAALYDIYRNHYNKEPSDEEWEHQTLVQWNNLSNEKDITVEDIYPLFINPKLKKYFTDKGLSGKINRLIKSMRQSDVIKNSITEAMLLATDLLRKMKGLPVYIDYLDLESITDMEYIINKVQNEHRIDLYAVDVESIVKSESSFEDTANNIGISSDIIYKIKGMFR